MNNLPQLELTTDWWEVNPGEINILDDFQEGESNEIELPYLYAPRDYQQPVWHAFFPQDENTEPVKRATLVWHRRAGKDKTCINLVMAKAMERVGTYLYLLPTQTQARKVVWHGIGKDGVKFLDHFPDQLVTKQNGTEMLIELVNGSIIQLGGSDNYNAHMGTNPVGIVFSEYSLQDPLAWDYFRPILAENGGWAIFEYTPRSRNHGWFMYERARKLAKRENGGWFCQLLKVTDSNAIPLEAIEEERESGMSDEMIEQEFFCSFDAMNQGAIFGKQIKRAWNEGRIGFVPPESKLPVYTFWDLGYGDATAIWLVQAVGKEIRMIGYYENAGEAMTHYFAWLEDWRKERNLTWGGHYGPHDIEVHEYTTGRKRIDVARDHGFVFNMVPAVSMEDQIEAARGIFQRVWIDETACERGLACLSDWSYKWDEDRKIYKSQPEHDWTSHAAEAFRKMALAWKDHVMGAGPQDLVTGPNQASQQNQGSSWGVF